MTRLLLLLILLPTAGMISSKLHAQVGPQRTLALQYLRTHTAELGLEDADVRDLAISSEYRSQHNGLTHVWIRQQYAGIPVFNGLIGLHVQSNGQVVCTGHRFVAHLAQKINTTSPALSAANALARALDTLGHGGQTLRLLQQTGTHNYRFEPGIVSRLPIAVHAAYVPVANGELQLAWIVEVEEVANSDSWSIQIDAFSGRVLDKHNRTRYCNPGDLHAHDAGCYENRTAEVQNAKVASTDATYRVFALPTESPAHGARSLLTDPADPAASPFGWHDVDGAEGAEYSYSRGNNVWAYLDIANDNNGTVNESVDGGANLNFDFPFDPNAEPAGNSSAGLTNLFYTCNKMHDWTYIYGFDEAAGNFQMNNYGNGGLGNDALRAEGLDGLSVNNATFVAPRDSLPPRMQMFKWTSSGGNFVNINAPAEISGTLYAQAASFGGAITSTPLTADVVVYDDGTGGPPLGCEPPINNLSGKIVMTDRGGCDFSEKALNVQQAGGVACIVCNYTNNTSPLGPGAFGGQVTIPALMLSRGDCDAIKQYINQGLNVSLVQPPVSGPKELDGNFDNGIVAHEYTHGISIRLTGGPLEVDCLENDEQMGEGWSDFFALAATHRPGDSATTNRGIATYGFRQPNNGTGARRYPYNTDMSVSPVTFGTVAENTGVHQVGEVWAAMLWDLYWAMIDEYGFDADWSNQQSGNARALQLVMDGMKLQPCYPGFKDARDAILAADRITYNGTDTCLISKVFARRGLGIGASQGSFTMANDGIENFDPIPTCITTLKIKKTTATPTLTPEEVAIFNLTVTNHKGSAVSGVVVTDEIPEGLNFVSATNGGQLVGNTVRWNIGNMSNGQVLNLQYFAKTSANGSVRLLRDQMDEYVGWISQPLNGENFFDLQSSDVVTGAQAWKATGLAEANDFVLIQEDSFLVSGTRPVLRFWNKYNTEIATDAGFIEVLPENGLAWVRFERADALRNGYTAAVAYSTIAIPFLNGYSGNSNGWQHSYFDLSQFNGQHIKLRFRYVSNPNTASNGWLIDDLEVLDLLAYEGEACVSSAEGDQACVKAPNAGVIMNPGTIGTNSPQSQVRLFTVLPNPATDYLYLNALSSVSGTTRVTLLSTEGRVVATQAVQQAAEGQVFPIEVHQLNKGLYYLHIRAGMGTQVIKVLIQ